MVFVKVKGINCAGGGIHNPFSQRRSSAWFSNSAPLPLSKKRAYLGGLGPEDVDEPQGEYVGITRHEDALRDYDPVLEVCVA